MSTPLRGPKLATQNPVDASLCPSQVAASNFVVLVEEISVDAKLSTCACPLLAAVLLTRAVLVVQSVDLVFSKVKPKGERKITFSQVSLP